MNINQYDPEKINNLLFKITDSDASIQKSAIYQLGEMKAILAIPNLVELLNNENTYYDTKCSIIESLGKIGSSDITEPLICCLYNEAEDFNIRRIAIKVLAQNIDDGNNLLVLLRFANDEQQDTFLRQQVKYLIINKLKKLKKSRQEKQLQHKKIFLEKLFAKDWQEAEKLLVSSNRSDSTRANNSKLKVSKAKSIKLEHQEFALIIVVKLEDNDELNIIFGISSLSQTNRKLPPGLELAFLSPSGKQVYEQVISKGSDEQIQFKFPLSLEIIDISREENSPFIVRVKLKENIHIELFPDNSTGYIENP